MKKLLLIVGIAGVAACVVCLLLAALNLSAYHSLMDGSAEQYHRLYRRAIACGLLGAAFGAIGAASFFFRARP